MSNNSIKSAFGLIGGELELKTDVEVQIDDNGNISKLTHENPPNSLKIKKDSPNYLLIPGFINSHVHIGDSFAKETGFNKSLIEVVAPPYGLKHQLLKNTSDDIIVEGIKAAIMEMISNGITTFADFREQGVKGIELLKTVIKNEPIEVITLGRFQDSKELERIYNIADGLGFSSYKIVSDDIIQQVIQKREQLRKLVFCHLAEVSRNDDYIKRILKDGIVDGIVHGTHLTKPDLIAFQQNNVSLIICPRSNGYFGVGFPPINEINDIKMDVAIGSDNIMANTPDLLEELRYLYRVHRNLTRNSVNNKLKAVDLLKMVTINAAKILGLDSSIGSISEGKQADFIQIDLNAPNLFCELNQSNLLPLIINRTKSENIKRVFKKGVLIFER